MTGIQSSVPRHHHAPPGPTKSRLVGAAPVPAVSTRPGCRRPAPPRPRPCPRRRGTGGSQPTRTASFCRPPRTASPSAAAARRAGRSPSPDAALAIGPVPPAEWAQIAADGGEIEIWGDGLQTRSFLYIDECLEATRRLVESTCIQPVNIGSEEMVTINQLATMIMEIAGKTLIQRVCERAASRTGIKYDRRYATTESNDSSPASRPFLSRKAFHIVRFCAS